MSNLAQYRALEAQLQQYKKDLQAISLTPEFKAELEFESKLRALLVKHKVSAQTAIRILSPEPITASPPQRKDDRRRNTNWAQVKYTNPHTGESAIVRSTNTNPVRIWREQYGADVIKSWGVQV